MKYTDKQRLRKIYDNVSKLNQYIKDKGIDYSYYYETEE